MAPSLQTIAANQVAFKTLVRLEHALSPLLIRERAAAVIQTAYRMAKEARRQRMLAEVEKVNAAWEKPWALTGHGHISVAGGWMELHKWDYVNDGMMKDDIYCYVRFKYDKVTKSLVW